MRKILLSVVACCAVIAFVPASALAHGHHKRHHRVHHARVRDFGSTSSTSSGQTSQGSGQTAGTVQSFSGGVLTIALTNGSTVSGTVTGDTEIECQSADMSGTSGWQSHDHGGSNNGSSGSGDSSNQGDDDQGQGDDDNNAGQTCDMSSLTQGAVVQEAELKITSAGAVWKNVDLASSSSSSSSSGS
jgi:hypothetical protein